MPKSIPTVLRSTWREILSASLVLCSAASVRAEEIKIAGTGAGLGTMQLLAETYAKSQPDTKITVLPSMGSGGGIKAVLSGAVQIGLSSRPLTEAESHAGALEVEYGRTPLVFATSTSNKTAGFTSQNLVDIYAGNVEQWPDGTRIRLVLRPMGDSDSELIKGLSPQMREAMSAAEQRKGMSFSVTDQDAAKNIEKIPGALGPSTLAQIFSEHRPIKALMLNGVVPNANSVADGSYPLHKRLLFVTGPKTSAGAHEFINFVRSSAGREILIQTGHWVK